MSAAQRLREQLERALVHATTRREERHIGRVLVELQESLDFREHAALRETRPVRIPPEFSLPACVPERSAVPPHAGGGRV